jgi:hypothetical protein
MLLAFFFNPETSFLGRLEPEVLSWVTIVGGFTLLLGVVSIVRVNYSSVKRKSSGWGYKLATLISIFAMALPAILPVRWSSLFAVRHRHRLHLRLAVQLYRFSHDVHHVRDVSILYRLCRL